MWTSEGAFVAIWVAMVVFALMVADVVAIVVAIVVVVAVVVILVDATLWTSWRMLWLLVVNIKSMTWYILWIILELPIALSLGQLCNV